MYTYKSIRHSIATTLLVVSYLLASLLPANAAPIAQETNSCAAQNLQAAATEPTVVTPVSADEQVVIPPEAANKSMQQYAWRLQFMKFKDEFYPRQVEDAVANAFYLYTDMGKDGNDLFERWRDKYEKRMGVMNNPFIGINSDLLVHTMLDTALEMPELASVVLQVYGRLTQLDGDSIFATVLDDVATSAKNYDIGDRILKHSDQLFLEVYDCAQKNPKVAEVVDRQYKKNVGVSIRDNAKTIIAKNPDVPLLKEINDRLKEDGSISISLNELKELSKTEFGKINATIDQIQTTLYEIDEKQDVIIDYLKDQELKAKHQEMVKKKAAEYQLLIEAGKSSIAILTTLSTQIDPDYAKHVAGWGNFGLQVADAAHGWVKATAGLGALDRVFSLSTVVATGNILGAVMSLVNLYGEKQPNPDQLILDEIGKMREQVQELRVEMHGRFDRIDLSLNSIYTTMMERFNQVDIQLGTINGNIAEVQQSLLELDLKLSRIERNNFEFLNTLGRRPLLDAINGGLGYLERTGQPMPYQPDFVTFENTLHGWATIHAFDPLNAGPTQRDFSDAQMLSELSAYPFDANINYINGWLTAHGMPGISNKRLPSPRDWLFASRAYTQLALEWPEHMQRIDPKRGESLRQIGLELEAAMRNLSTLVTVSDTLGNQLLFSSVITNYQNKIDAFDLAIEGVENAYMNEVRMQLERSEPFLIHGGAYQAMSYLAAPLKVADCSVPAFHAFELPSQIFDRLPSSFLFNLADYLKVGRLYACVYDEWYNQTEECVIGECYTVADHNVVLVVEFDGKRLLRQTIPLQRERIPTSSQWIDDHYKILNFKNRFARLTTIDPMTPQQEAQFQEIFTKTLKKTEEQLAAQQHELYRRILNEMDKGSLKPVVAEVDGSKALIDALVSLGLPRAVSNDEFLHAMLYGNQQLVDQRPLVQNYVSRMTQPLEGTNLTLNPRELLAGVADERRQAFKGLIDQYLTAISDELYSEEADYLAISRRSLELTMRIVEMENGAPSVSTKQVFLPLVQK